MHWLHLVVLWCALLPVVIYATENQGNFTREDERGDIAQHEFPNNFITSWKHDENSTRDDEVQHEFRSNYTNNLHKKGERQNQNVLIESHDNLTDDRGTIMSFELDSETNFDGDKLKEICNSMVCIPICCELGYRLVKGTCIADPGNYSFPEVYKTNKQMNEVFQLIVSDPCQKTGRYLLNPDEYLEDEYVILANGSIYQPSINYIVDLTTYCFALVKKNKYEPTICFNVINNVDIENEEFAGITAGLIISLPFFLLTFVVYTILPELWNMQGYILRGYVGSLFVAYTLLAVLQLMPPEKFSEHVCVALAFITYFSSSASFLWLNVICFDFWWTFGEFHQLQESMTREKRKRFMIYSIYVWGCTSILIIVCAIMNFAPVPRNFITPGFGIDSCWFTDEAILMYFYGPISFTIICNTFLFIITTLRFVWHKKDTDLHLIDLDANKLHDTNKQSFILYLKLIILTVINWSMQIILWIFRSAPWYIWYLCDLTNSLQGIIIFIIFVWKDKIKKLLLRRFNCQECTFSIFSRNSPRSFCPGAILCTCIMKGLMYLWENINPCKRIYTIWTNRRAKNWSVNTESSEVFYYINAPEGFYCSGII